MRKLTPLGALLSEWRLPVHVLHLAFSTPFLFSSRRGQQKPIYVIPGYLTSDYATFVLRRFLSAQGYDVYGWGLGTNRGGSATLFKKISERLQQIHNQKKKKITLIGWSLGGYLAREVARDHPEIIDHVITLGSPNTGEAKFTAFESRNKRDPKTTARLSKMILEREKNPIHIPITSIYSKLDRVVAWQASYDKDKRHKVNHIEVKSSHVGLGFHPTVYKSILTVLRGL